MKEGIKMDQDIGLWTVIILTFIFMASYFWGRRKNYKIQKDMWKTLRKFIAPYGKRVDFKSYGTSAFQISVPGRKTGFFRRTELTVALLPREILLYFLFQKIRGKMDELIVKTQFKSAPKFSLEIIPRKMEVPERLKSKFKEVETNSFERISFFSSKEKLAKLLLDEAPIRKRLKAIEGNLRFLSLSADEPHLIFACNLSSEIFPQIFPLIESLGSKIYELSMARKGRKNIK